MLDEVLQIAFGFVFSSTLILDKMLSIAFGFVFSSTLIFDKMLSIAYASVFSGAFMLDEILRIVFGFIFFSTLILDDILWMTDMNTIHRNDIGEAVLLTLGNWSPALWTTTGAPKKIHLSLQWPRTEDTEI